MNTIVIDCGASFLKGALFQDGRIVKKERQPSPLVHGAQDILETVQIRELVPQVQQMIRRLATEEREVRLCISNEMHGFILAQEDGTPYTDYISWQKEYGAVEVSGKTAFAILNRDSLKEDIMCTGMPLRAGLPSCNLLYLSRKGYLKGYEPKLYFYTLGDYILKVLSKKEPICHSTNAAATGLYDLNTGNWNGKLISAAGGDKIIFPVIGIREVKFELGDLKIHALPAIGDQQAALLGAGLEDENTISFNLGTGAQVSKLVSKPVYNKEYQIRPYFCGNYLSTIPFLPSGRALNVFIRFFKEIFQNFDIEVNEEKIWEVFLKEGKSGNCNALSCDLSFYENSVTRHCLGSIGDIGEYSLTVGNLLASIFEQMSKNFTWAAEIIEPHLECIKKVIFSGGIANKIDIIRENIINMFNDVEVYIASDETFRGLYLYGTMEGEETS